MRFSIGLPRHEWKAARDRALAAEAAGFDAVSLTDHLGYPADRPMLESWTLATAVAVATTTIGVQLGVLSQRFRNPALLVKMATALDDISSGRLRLAIGAGMDRREHEMFGYGFPAARTRLAELEEYCVIVKGMLSARDEAFTYAGKHYQVTAARNLPSPVRRIPITVAASGDRALRVVASVGDGWNCAAAYLDRYEERSRRLDGLLGGRRITRSVNVPISVRPSPAAPQDAAFRGLSGPASVMTPHVRAIAAAGFCEVWLIPRDEEAFAHALRVLPALRSALA